MGDTGALALGGQTVKLKTSRLNKGDHKDDEDPLSYTVSFACFLNAFMIAEEKHRISSCTVRSASA